jgi:hypothetical protein
MLRSSLFFLGLLYLSFSHCVAQIPSDTSFIAIASANAIKIYSDFIQGQTGLYTGSEYQTPDRTNEQHPFYRQFDWLEGSVDYDGERYDKLSLLYDITSDNLITEHYYNGEEIVLVKAKIKGFTIGGDEFVNVSQSSMVPGLPAPGFYHVLYDGPSKALGQYFKLMEERIENNAIERYFTPRTRYYLLKNGEYHKVSRRSEVFRLFDDQRPALRAYVAREKIKISKFDPGSIAKVAAYYDSLNSKK